MARYSRAFKKQIGVTTTDLGQDNRNFSVNDPMRRYHFDAAGTKGERKWGVDQVAQAKVNKRGANSPLDQRATAVTLTEARFSQIGVLIAINTLIFDPASQQSPQNTGWVTVSQAKITQR